MASLRSLLCQESARVGLSVFQCWWCLLRPAGKKHCRTLPLENPAKGTCVVFWEMLFSLCSGNAFRRKRNNSYFSWGRSEVTSYGGCHIVDHVGNLVHLFLPCFVDTVFVFKRGFGTWIDKLARRDSQRVFFALIHHFPLIFHVSEVPLQSQRHASCGVEHWSADPKHVNCCFSNSELVWAPAV